MRQRQAEQEGGGEMTFGEYDFRTFRFGRGAHPTREDGMCVMEAVAFVAGEPHSDAPHCACPVISTFIRSWNDDLDDDDRGRLLAQFVFRLPGTRASAAIEMRRAHMSLDWLVRVNTSAWLALVPELTPHAAALRTLPEIDSRSIIQDVVAALSAAEGAARIAAEGATWGAAMSAAEGAVRSAAWGAAWRSAVSAAVRAAVNAAESPAENVAWWAAVNAAESTAENVAWWAAVRATSRSLDNTVTMLQQSACDLVDRMIRMTEPAEVVPHRKAVTR